MRPRSGRCDRGLEAAAAAWRLRLRSGGCGRGPEAPTVVWKVRPRSRTVAPLLAIISLHKKM